MVAIKGLHAVMTGDAVDLRYRPTLYLFRASVTGFTISLSPPFLNSATAISDLAPSGERWHRKQGSISFLPSGWLLL